MYYKPDEDTFFLLDNIEPKGRIIEIGAGSGFISFTLAERGYDVTATDIDDDAISHMEKLKKEKRLNLRILKSDLFENIEGKFDTVIFNPPYLPGNIDEDRTIYGGKNGQEIIEKFLQQADKYLEKGGKIYIVLSSFNNLEDLIRNFPKYKFNKKAEKNFFFHAIYLYELVTI